jgi:hypothetical protein
MSDDQLYRAGYYIHYNRKGVRIVKLRNIGGFVMYCIGVLIGLALASAFFGMIFSVRPF